MDTVFESISIQTIAFGSCHKNSYVSSQDPSCSSSSDNSSASSSVRSNGTIWHSITHKTKPDLFLWLGDAVYSPNSKGIASLDTLAKEYQTMLTDTRIGYTDFLHSMQSSTTAGMIIGGTWDDHDYGGNDYGKEMIEKIQRQGLFLKFLHNSTKLASKLEVSSSSSSLRQGVYSAMTFHGPSSSSSSSILVLSLDTRSGRDYHIIPSLGGNKYFPKLGSIIGSFTRWLTAAFYRVPLYSNASSSSTSSRSINTDEKSSGSNASSSNRVMLDEEQWKWLEQYLSISSSSSVENLPSVILILSSIQVLTTNPLFESWGHFPQEKLRLLRLVNDYSKTRKERNTNDSFAILFLSGDVHHGEILDSSQILLSSRTHHGDTTTTTSSIMNGRIMEVTSSGMTHSLSNSFHKIFVGPALDIFSSHRYKATNNKNNNKNRTRMNHTSFYFLGRNYGSIQIHGSSSTNPQDDDELQLQINIHNHHGDVILTSMPQPLSFYSFNMTDQELYDIAYSCLNGHVLNRILQGMSYLHNISVLLVVVFMGLVLWKRREIRPWRRRKQLQPSTKTKSS